MLFLVPLLLLLAQQSRDLRIEPESPPNRFGDKGSRWALVVGVSEHEHLPPQAQLRFAHRDAEDFAAFLRSDVGGGIPASHVRLLTNRKATLANIRASLHTWLVESAGENDIVYVFFAGHGVVAERGEGYLLAADSDPQNLHATGIGFSELEQTLATRLKAALVILAADACHAGQLGWTSYGNGSPDKTAAALESMGSRDRAILKLLAARPTERSFEDIRWDGGHGVFTHSLLTGLRGAADQDGDRLIRASEAIDFVTREVAAQTAAKQNPRVAGSFDARLALAALPRREPAAPPMLAAPTVSLDIRGPAGTAIYLDRIFRGSLPVQGQLRIEGLASGLHAIAAEFVQGQTLEGAVRLSRDSALQLAPPATIAAARMEREAGLEQMAQACVSDYVQSTAVGPRQQMLARAVEAFEALKKARPYDRSLETKRLFCSGRLDIASGRLEQAVTTLRAAILRDPDFACAHNALGVAYARLGKAKEARASFDKAAELTPEWALPPFQIAGALIAGGKLKEAVPYLERATRLSPRSAGNLWSLARAYRNLNRLNDAVATAQRLIELDANYAPGYFELARALDLAGDNVRAILAYEVYLQLAPNFGDSDAVRSRATQMRSVLSKKEQAALHELP